MTYLVSCPGTPAEDALIAGALMADARVRGCAVDVYEYINLQDREPFEVTLTPRPGAHGVRHSQAHGRDHHLPTAVANAWLAMFGRGAGCRLTSSGSGSSLRSGRRHGLGR